MVQIKIRPARNKDISFLGWVMFTAARSHLDESPWSVIFHEPETRTRILLERMSQIPALSWSHVSKFWIAEVDGVPAAAMCGFEPMTESSPIAEFELDVAKQAFNYSEERLTGVRDRLTIATSGFPKDLPDIWGIENVAVLPEFRGKGLLDRLFGHILEEGMKKGFKRAQILCLIGNEPGQQAFERNGFKVLSQKTNPAFNELFGTPGARLLAQDL
ncbi:MAG: GNAT family N-acetyltransferase [Gammaproteobacteria bacterium]|nr:GNAT family N-acetyltransferase [Gammaproteobacteria bacterium]